MNFARCPGLVLRILVLLQMTFLRSPAAHFKDSMHTLEGSLQGAWREQGPNPFQVFGSIYAGTRRAICHVNRDAVTMPKRPQLLQ